MLRGLMLLLLVLSAGFVALPFVTTSRALDEHGIIVAGSVYHKDEYVRIVDSGWELSRTVTIEYTVPETGSVTFFQVHPDVQRYDSLHLKQAVDVRHLPSKSLPEVPGVKFWSAFHALPTARLADVSGISRLAALQTPRILLGCKILGGILVLLIVWRLTKISLYGWAAGIGVALFLAFFLLQGFPARVPAPARDVRHATGHVTNIGRIDKLFSSSHNRGVVADQPVDVVSVEFVPEGRTEPVMAVDLIDRGSVSGLKEKAAVNVDYEAASPRTAYIAGATRRFPERNSSGTVVAGLVYVAMVGGLLWLASMFGRGYKKLLSRAQR